MSAQSFTKNYNDHSNDSGYQFEFFCDKCGNGHRSSFETSSLGLAAGVMKAAGALFGGGIERAGWGADRLKDTLRGPVWDSAFKKAIEECRPKFRQCTKCGSWVCPEVCWNHERGLCENCAPDLRENVAAAQAQAAVDQAAEKLRQSDQIRGFDVASVVTAAQACSKCQATLANGARFCASCGIAVVVQAAGPKFCSGCGAQLQAGARFCQGCGGAVPV